MRWYRFASPDKTRPVLILTRDSILDYLGEVTIAPITSTIRDIPSEVVLTEADGMRNDCAVNLDHVQTVAKGRLQSGLHKRDRILHPEEPSPCPPSTPSAKLP